MLCILTETNSIFDSQIVEWLKKKKKRKIVAQILNNLKEFLHGIMNERTNGYGLFPCIYCSVCARE